MKLVARMIAALALVAFATPALPCGAEKSTTTAKADTMVPAQQPATTVAKADKAKKAERSQKAKRAAQSTAATN